MHVVELVVTHAIKFRFYVLIHGHFIYIELWYNRSVPEKSIVFFYQNQCVNEIFVWLWSVCENAHMQQFRWILSISYTQQNYHNIIEFSSQWNFFVGCHVFNASIIVIRMDNKFSQTCFHFYFSFDVLQLAQQNANYCKCVISMKPMTLIAISQCLFAINVDWNY